MDPQPRGPVRGNYLCSMEWRQLEIGDLLVTHVPSSAEGTIHSAFRRRSIFMSIPRVHGACVLLLALCSLALPSCGNSGTMAGYDIEGLAPGERAVVSLPLEFDVRPDCRLYVYGERVLSVRLATTLGDSLRLNRVPVLPHRTPPRTRSLDDWSDERYLKIFGRVPLVQERIASGTLPEEAVTEFLNGAGEIRSGLRRVYMGARESGLSAEAAALDALAHLAELDTLGLINTECNNRAQGNRIFLCIKGIPGEEELVLHDTPPAVPDRRPPSEREKALLATELYERLLLGRSPCWYFITSGGKSIFCGDESVAGVEAQIERARRTGVLGSSYLAPHIVKEVLGKEGL